MRKISASAQGSSAFFTTPVADTGMQGMSKHQLAGAGWWVKTAIAPVSPGSMPMCTRGEIDTKTSLSADTGVCQAPGHQGLFFVDVRRDNVRAVVGEGFRRAPIRGRVPLEDRIHDCEGVR